jgi:hypothetical protein
MIQIYDHHTDRKSSRLYLKLKKKIVGLHIQGVSRVTTRCLKLRRTLDLRKFNFRHRNSSMGLMVVNLLVSVINLNFHIKGLQYEN